MKRTDLHESFERIDTTIGDLIEAITQIALEAGKTELIPGFISKKKRPFDAYLLLSKSGKVTFEFPPRTPRNNKNKLTAPGEKGTRES